MKIEIDGRVIQSESAFHYAISKALHFPHSYGNNLDALSDILTTDVERPLKFTWKNSDASRTIMGAKFDRIVEVLRTVEAKDINWGIEDKFQFYLN